VDKVKNKMYSQPDRISGGPQHLDTDRI